jgi:hypothetical protein
VNRTLAPPEEAKVPGVSFDRGSTVSKWVDCTRRMEVITMAVVAILIAAGVIALIYAGLFFVVWAAWFAMCSA